MVNLNKKIPNKPGVYFFRDSKRRILYIGKASNLKNRLGSYFDSRPKDPRISKMLTLAAGTDYQITNSEIEALILESQLIKKHRPDFNIMLRDDKQYFYVVFTRSVNSGQAKEKFPKIFITHQPYKFRMTKSKLQKKFKIQKLKKNWYLRFGAWDFHSFDAECVGPFTDGSALKSALKLLRKIFPYCTCKQKHNNYCLNYHIGKCLGICCLKNTSPTREQISAYNKNVQATKDILNGKRVTLIKKLEKEMMQKGGQNQFEDAIKLRGQIEKLKQVFENAQIIQELGGTEILKEFKKTFALETIPDRIEGYDVSNIQGELATGVMVVFTNGKPDKNEYRKFKIHREAQGDTAMLKEVLNRRFKHNEWRFPELILIDGGKGQLNVAISTLKILGLNIPIIALTKNEKHAGDHIFYPARNRPPQGDRSHAFGGAVSNGVSTTVIETIDLVKLPKNIRNLILHIDVEAHRFAIGYYRNLHKRNMIL